MNIFIAAGFIGFLAMGLTITSCKKNSSSQLLLAEEHAANMANLNLGVVGFLENFSIDSMSLSLGRTPVIRVLDSTVSDGSNAVMEIDFGAGIDCRDGQKRFGIWQIQYNNNDSRLADSIWLFLQQSNPDTSGLNAGIGWKGEAFGLSGTVLLTRLGAFQQQLSMVLTFSNFSWKTDFDVTISGNLIRDNNNQLLGCEDSWIGSIKHRLGASVEYRIASDQLVRHRTCTKTYAKGIIFLEGVDQGTASNTKVLFNPFGDNPAPCDDKAKLERSRDEKMITLW